METTDDKKVDPCPAAAPRPARPEGSGEGSSSALEQLIQLERTRHAQTPREGGSGTSGTPRPGPKP